MKTLKERINATPLIVGRWQGKVDLEFVPLEDHSMIVGQDFLRLARAVSVPHVGWLVFLEESGAWSFPLTTKSKLGHWPRMSSVQVFEDHGKSKNLAQDNIRQPHTYAKKKSKKKL